MSDVPLLQEVWKLIGRLTVSVKSPAINIETF